MKPEDQLHERRQALNTAINNHDPQAVAAFLHPEFVARGVGGHSYDRQTAIRQLEQMLQPSLDFQSEVEVEEIEVSEDSATLKVRREERAQMSNRGHLVGNLIVAAVFVLLALRVVFGGGQNALQFWGTIIAYAVCCVWFISRAFRGGPRSIHQTQRAQETWLRVDESWLLVEEEQVS